MKMVAPLGPVYQAGTLSGNPLAMAAGVATLRRLKQEGTKIYSALEENSAAVASGVAEVARRTGIQVIVNRVGSMFTWFFTGDTVRDHDDAARSDTHAFASFHRGMLENGVYLPPSQFEAAFVSYAHEGQEIEKTLAAASRTFQEFAELQNVK
jgi:glutamate-1-semialdehyde 2,1-aminomutase